MTLRGAMLEASLASRDLLGDAFDRVVGFVDSQRADDGGWRGRGAGSDLYYTAFGTGCLLSLDQAVPDDVIAYLETKGDGEGLDFVHLCCLVRCWTNTSAGAVPRELRAPIAARLERYRAGDGGFAQAPGKKTGTAYGAFLALGALEDLDHGLAIDDARALIDGLQRMRTLDGGYANEVGQKIGVTTLTSGVVALQRNFGCEIDHDAGEWLLKRMHPLGGFQASPQVPIPDLLSTATAMQALDFVQCECNEAEIRTRCLEFLDTVWDEDRGAFCGHAFDRKADVEYTWYGLLAAGHLIEPPEPAAESR